jgi:hypothetical protein
VFNIWPLDVDLRALYMAFRRRPMCAIYDLQTWMDLACVIYDLQTSTWCVLYMAFRRRRGVCCIRLSGVDLTCTINGVQT